MVVIHLIIQIRLINDEISNLHLFLQAFEKSSKIMRRHRYVCIYMRVCVCVCGCVCGCV